MKKRVQRGIVVLFAVLALCYVSEVRAEDMGTVNISGTWAAHGIWNELNSWTDTLTIMQKGKRISGHTSGGLKLKGSVKNNSVTFKVLDSCFPLFKGTASNTSMRGTSACTRGQGTGTWGAKKASGPELSGASVAGPGE